VALTADVTVRATFTLLVPYTLKVTKAGRGRGSVVSSPAGIDCGADCSERYIGGTTVTLTATPVAGHTFVGWQGAGGACGGSGPCTVTITGNLNIVARFAVFTLRVTKAGNGRGTVVSSPAGIDCGRDCLENYTGGTTVTLTATPDPGHAFVGWQGAGGACGGTGPCIVTVTANRNIVARFSRALTLRVQRAGPGQGSVVSTPAGITCGADCTEAYAAGTTVTLTATPAAGSTFAGWMGACSGTGPCTLTLTGNTVVGARFVVLTLRVRISGSGRGSVVSSPAGIDCPGDCLENVTGGTSVTLTATPASGSTFVGWSGGCSGTGPCTATVGVNVTITAEFARSSGGGGGGGGSGGGGGGGHGGGDGDKRGGRDPGDPDPGGGGRP
jgi:hypothetical protein